MGEEATFMSAIETAVRIVIDLIVRRQYDVIDHACPGSLFTGRQLKNSVHQYGRTPVPPGDEWWSTVEVTPLNDGTGFHVAAPLWTEEEGRSDLTLELRLQELAPQAFGVQVLGLHVL